MRGLERLQTVRRGGLRPQVVHLDMPGMGLSTGSPMEGQILVEQGDTPSSVDLRALRGLCVIAMGITGDMERIEQWAWAAIDAGAKDVGVAVFNHDGSTEGPVWVCRNGETLEPHP